MNAKRFTDRLRVFLFLGILLPPGDSAIAQEKQATAIERFASLLEQTLKSVTGAPEAKPPALAPAVDIAVMAAPAVARPEKDVEIRLKRLQSHAVVLQDWIDVHVGLSDEQTEHLTEGIAKEISRDQTLWKAGGVQQRNQRVLDDFFLICFTDKNGPARNLERASHNVVFRNDFLSSEQSDKLSRAVSERQEFHREAVLGHVLNLLDNVFFFTREQREKISEAVASTVDLSGTCFATQSPAQAARYSQYFDHVSVFAAFGPDKHRDVLTDSQKSLAKELMSAASDAREYFLIRTGDDMDTLAATLKEATTSQREKLARRLAVRIDFHRATRQLSDQQVRRLQVGGKGAIDDVLTKWKAQTVASVERFRKQEQFAGRNVSIGMSFPHVSQLTENDLWKTTVDSVTHGDSATLADRRAIQREATAKFVVTMLERELWLEPFQRERLLASLKDKLPIRDEYRRRQWHTNEISLLCVPLFNLSKLELTILSPAQRVAMKRMKEPLTVNNGYVRVQTKRNGTFSFAIPK